MQERCVLQPEPTGYIPKDWFQESQHVRQDTLCSLPAFQVYLVAYSRLKLYESTVHCTVDKVSPKCTLPNLIQKKT
jgi:hypothetical protein